MEKQTGRRIAAGVLCIVLLLLAGCSGENDKNIQLKTTDKPQFIPGGIRSVSLKKDGKEYLHIANVPAEYKMSFDYWEILNPYDENITVNTEVMFKMFEILCSFSFETPIQVGEGIDTGIQSPDMGFSVEYVDTMDDSVAQATDDADTRAEIILGKEDGDGGRYAAVAGNEDQVYVLPEPVLQMLYERKPFDYILKIPVLIPADTLRSVEIQSGGEQYKIQVDAAAESYKFGRKKMDKKEFASLYQAISGIMLVSETDEAGSGKKEDSELTVSFCRNTPEAPNVQVSYYFYDDEYDSVEINGKEWFLVRKEDVKELIEQIEAVK